MLLPFDPLLTVRVAALRLTVRLSTLGVLTVVALGLAASDGASPVHPVRLAGAGLVLGMIAVATLVPAVATLRAARRRGLSVRRVHLLTFGTVVEADSLSPNPRTEVEVGLAGLLAAGLVTGLVALTGVAVPGRPSTLEWTWTPLAVAGVLALVQAMPALPTAGGRLLVALGWYLTDDRRWATRAATLYAHVVAAGLIVAGVLLLGATGSRPFWGLWALVAGWQLSGVARAMLDRGWWAEFAWAMSLGEAVAALRPLPARTPIADALEALIAAGPGASVLVTADDGEPVGVVRLGDLRAARRAEWDRVTVGEVAAPLAGLPRMGDGDPAGKAVALLEDGRPLLVVGEDGRPVAAVTRAQLVRRLAERAAGGRPRATPGGSAGQPTAG